MLSTKACARASSSRWWRTFSCEAGNEDVRARKATKTRAQATGTSTFHEREDGGKDVTNRQTRTRTSTAQSLDSTR